MFTPITSVEPQIDNQDKTKELLNFLQQDINNTMKMEQYKQQQKGIKIDETTNKLIGEQLLKNTANTPYAKEIEELVNNPYIDNEAVTKIYDAKIKKDNVGKLFDLAKENKLTSKDLLKELTNKNIGVTEYNNLLRLTNDYSDENTAFNTLAELENTNPAKSYKEFSNRAIKLGLKPGQVNAYWDNLHPKASGGGSGGGSAEGKPLLSEQQAKIKKHVMRKDGLTIDGNRVYIKGDDAKPYALVGHYGFRNGVYVKYVNGAWRKRGEVDPSDSELTIEIPKSIRNSLVKAVTEFEQANIDARGRNTDFSNTAQPNNTNKKEYVNNVEVKDGNVVINLANKGNQSANLKKVLDMID